MGRVLRAFPQRLFELAEQGHPFGRRWAALLSRWPESGLESPGDSGREILKRRNGGGRRHADGAFAGIGESEFRDGLGQGHVAFGVSADERVPSHVEKQEDRDCEAEGVVVRGAHDVAELDALKLGRGVFGNAHAAEVAIAPVNDLEAVGIDERDRGVRRNENARMVDVADDASGLVDRADGFRGIEGRTC